MDADRVFLTAEWRYLVMLNYEVDSRLLLPLVPAGTELDGWNGKVFVSLVGFLFLKTKLFGFLAIPRHSDFEEVNLRFYVRRETAGEIRRGVVFIREIVPRRAIALVARTFYNENYIALPMAHHIDLNGDDCLSANYRWGRGNDENQIRVETVGNSKLPTDGSFEQFITEHFWGYAAQPDGGCVEYRVTHPSWKVWQVRQSAFEGNVEKLYGRNFEDVLHGKPESAFVAEGSQVTVMRGRRM